jgi:hypothetical protein
MKTQEEIVTQAKAYAEFIGNEDGTSAFDYIMGYNNCQQDMADNKYTKEDIVKLMFMATKWDTFKDGDVEHEMNMSDFFKYLINSLNKQD